MDILRSQLKLAQQETEAQSAVVKKLQAQLQTMGESNQASEKMGKKEKAAVAKKAGKTLQLSQKLENELKEEQLMSAGMRAQIKKLEDERNDEKKKTAELSKEMVEIKEQLRDSPHLLYSLLILFPVRGPLF
jgi:N-acetyl-beta-hexosaminidase